MVDQICNAEFIYSGLGTSARIVHNHCQHVNTCRQVNSSEMTKHFIAILFNKFEEVNGDTHFVRMTNEKLRFSTIGLIELS